MFFRTACYLMHTIVVYVWIILGTFLFGLTAIAVSLFARTSDSAHRVARMWGRSILWVSRIGVVVHGLDAACRQRSCIYMSNHQSNFDIPVLLGRLPVQFRWLAKAELFRIPIFGASMRGAGYISIDRSDRASAFESLDRAARIIRDGTSVMIFPEGTRSPDGEMLPFKKGGFVLAVDAGVPIVPIAIAGTHDIMPKGRLMVRPGNVYVKLQPPIETAGYTRKSKDELMNRIRASIVAGQAELQQGGSRA